MSMETTACPQCGAPASPTERKCGYCKAEFFVTSIAYLSRFDKNGLSKYLAHFKKLTKENPDNGEGWLGLGLCYLQSGLFPMAQNCFARAIEVAPELPQPYYYFALSRVSGRRLMTISMNEIREIEKYVAVAIQLDSNSAMFKLLLACVKRDYYETNGLRIPPPDADHLLGEIRGQSVEEAEMERLRQCVLIRDESIFAGIINT